MDAQTVGRQMAILIGISCFINPRGAKALARYWTYNYNTRPFKETPGRAFSNLIKLVAGHGSTMDLSFYFSAAGDSYVIRLLNVSDSLGIPREYLLQTEQLALLTAIQNIVHSEVAPKVFYIKNDTGVQGEITLAGFNFNKEIGRYYDASYLVTLMCAEMFKLLHDKLPAEHVDSPSIWKSICDDIINALDWSKTYARENAMERDLPYYEKLMQLFGRPMEERDKTMNILNSAVERICEGKAKLYKLERDRISTELSNKV